MNQHPEISFELLQKYNVQGPRYTSYPPAPSWSAEIGPFDYERIIRESNEDPHPAPLSLYLHLPFCEKLCYFCGCTTLITGKNRSFEDPYLSALQKEIQWLGQRVTRQRKVVQLHFGGGTPTYQSPEALKALMKIIKENFSISPEAEIGIEVDPRVTATDHIKALQEEGFNRLSMGVQDFDPQVQKAINRIQPYEETRDLVVKAREAGFESINMDLIYGLPYQTHTSFEQTIDKILGIGPDRLAVYSYAHVPWLKKHQDLLSPHLPSSREKYEIFMTALKKFTEAGFEYIGMDHFAKPDDELARARKDRTLWRNFMGYTTKAGTDLFGLGMSAIGGIHGAFVQNAREVAPYEEAIEKGGAATLRGFRLSKEDKLRARVIQSLLCHAVLVKSEIEKEFSINFSDHFSEALKNLGSLEEDGLVKLEKDKIFPTEVGRIFLRNIAMPFDAYLPKPGEKKIFSKTL